MSQNNSGDQGSGATAPVSCGTITLPGFHLEDFLLLYLEPNSFLDLTRTGVAPARVQVVGVEGMTTLPTISVVGTATPDHGCPKCTKLLQCMQNGTMKGCLRERKTKFILLRTATAFLNLGLSGNLPADATHDANLPRGSKIIRSTGD